VSLLQEFNLNIKKDLKIKIEVILKCISKIPKNYGLKDLPLPKANLLV
jgi:hypothetical protein